jgi:hypothetical protein
MMDLTGLIKFYITNEEYIFSYNHCISSWHGGL